MRVTHFWTGFDHGDQDPRNSPWSDFLFQGLDGSGLHIGSVFGHSRKPFDLLFSGENLTGLRNDGEHFVFKDRITDRSGRSRWFMGIPEIHHPQALHLPLYFCYWAAYRHRHGEASPKPPAKEFGLTVLVRNFKNGDLARKRVELAHQLSHFLPVHTNRALQPGAPADSKVIYHDVPDKLDFISRFSHHLCFQNSSRSGYLTEKIFDPLYVGAVPVYAGDPLADQWIRGEAFLDCQHLEAAEIADRIHDSDVLRTLVSKEREALSLVSFEDMRDRVADFNARVVVSVADGRQTPRGLIARGVASLRRALR